MTTASCWCYSYREAQEVLTREHCSARAKRTIGAAPWPVACICGWADLAADRVPMLVSWGADAEAYTSGAAGVLFRYGIGRVDHCLFVHRRLTNLATAGG